MKFNLDIRSEFITLYTDLANKHLEDLDTELLVKRAGMTNSGESIYGICVKSDGQEEWYDPDAEKSSAESIVGWNNEQDADYVLTNKVLPNLGYSIYLKDLMLFHQNT